MGIQDVLALIQAVDKHKLTGLKLNDGNIELSLKKKEASQVVNVTGDGSQGAPAWSATDVAAVPTAGAAAAGMPMTGVSNGAGAVEAVAGGISGGGLNGAVGIGSDKVISSPLVGIFYNTVTPELESFMKVGDTVRKGQVISIIEAMKLMNEIECELDSVVEAMLVNSEDVMEYGQPLFHIR